LFSILNSYSYARFSRFEDPYKSNQHWSQLKIKSLKQFQLPTGKYTILCEPKVPTMRRRRFSLDVDNIRGIPTRTGSARLNDDISNTLPPLYINQSCTKRRLPRTTSACNERAKAGYKYWLEEADKSTKAGVKINIGSKGTYLGLGVPRL
jgi:hypothetical protein